MPAGDSPRPSATCPSCAAEVPRGARFCPACGVRLEPMGSCPACGTPVAPGSRFCSQCGTATSSPGETPVAGGTDGATQPAASGRIGVAERRRVSILFVDLVDFTALAEHMDPEEVRAVQARYFEVARSIVASHGGTIEKFIGDAVMAVWGAPSAHEDDAERAVRAALAIVYAVERMGGAASGRVLQARAAVTTGEAAVSVGMVDQAIVAGDLVNVAARLQGRAPAGGVVVDRATRDAASKVVAFARVGSLSLKGRKGRLETFRVTSRRDDATVRSASHAGRLIGRDRELREITELLESVIAEGRGRLVSVTGIAGIGKSRLAWELEGWVDAHPRVIAWHAGRALAYGEGVAFSAVARMVRRRAGIADDAGPQLALRQLGAALDGLVRDDGERRWMSPRLAALLSGETAGDFDRDELFAAWRRFFERVSELSPVVMVFEDLHWADPSLLDFIEHLATWSRTRPIFILTLARPELLDARPTWGSAVGSFTAMTLDRLDDAAMRELLADRAPDLPPTLVEPLLRDAGGVPLYAVEVARMLVDRRGAGGQAQEAGGPVPDSLHGIIAARLDALPLAERRLLMAAAVLGNRFRSEAVHAVVDADAADLRDLLDGLVRREMLTLDEELGSPGRGQLTFVQDLVREVAYQTLSRLERRTLHLAAARYLDRLDDEPPEQLAAHLVAAHQLTTDPREAERIAHRAVSALRRASRAASALHVPARSLDLIDTALGLATAVERPALLAEAADAARAAGRIEVAEARLRELIELRRRAGDRSSAARARAQLASVMLTGQANEPALLELEAAMRDMRRWRSDPSGVELAAQLARARSLLGDDREALRWSGIALEAAERLGLPAVVTDLLITRGTARIGLGEHEAGFADLRDAIGRAEQAGMVRTELRARNNLAWGMLADDPRAALEIAQAGLALATEMGVGDVAVPLADLACAAAIETGAWDWALETIAALEERGVPEAYRIVLSATAATIHALEGSEAPLAALDRFDPLPSTTDPQVVGSVRVAQSWCAFLDGRLDEARDLAREGLAAVAGAIHPHERAIATRIALWMGDAATAATDIDRLREEIRWGRAAQATVVTLEAGLAALTRSGDAVRMYARARELWDGLELPLPGALCLLDQAHLALGDEPPDRLSELLGSLGAVGLRRLLPGAWPVSRPADGQRPARSRRPTAGTAHRSGAARPRRPATGPPPRAG